MNMKKNLLLLVLMLLPMIAMAQTNPKQGYIITNEGDTIRGTIDYLANDQNAKACKFMKAGESTFKSLSPLDIKGYRLANEGIYYVSRLLNTGDISQLQFAEFLLQGGVSLYRYFYEDETYFGIVGDDGKEVVVRDDKLNEDLSSFEEKVEARRGLVQQVTSVMYKDPSVASRLWKMDFKANSLLKVVKQYDERYCTDEVCVVFESDTKKSQSVKPHIYIGAGMSYSWFKSQQYDSSSEFLACEMKYSGIMPTIVVGADVTYPRQSKHLMTHIELGFTPYSIKASEQRMADAESRMKCSEFALKLGVGYLFAPEQNISPFLMGGLSVRHQISLKEENRIFEYKKNMGDNIPTVRDMDYGSVTNLGVYAGVGVNVSHFRFSAAYDQPFGGKNGVQKKGALTLSVGYIITGSH
jgi:hypothetical protein